MKIRLNNVKKVNIETDFIRLDALLKYLALVGTGGEAKAHIQDGVVFVNGEACTQRGKKLRHGDLMRFGGVIYAVTQKPPPDNTGATPVNTGDTPDYSGV